jgi:hypothetical protein
MTSRRQHAAYQTPTRPGLVRPTGPYWNASRAWYPTDSWTQGEAARDASLLAPDAAKYVGMATALCHDHALGPTCTRLACIRDCWLFVFVASPDAD